MITYNHENYISAAINGVLNQIVNFEFELIVSDDCSTDNTYNEIIKTIESQPHKSKVCVIRHDCNLGMMNNFIYTLKKAKGKYIATCEGDDFWIDRNKLQSQIDFLISNPAFSFHATQVKSINLSGDVVCLKPSRWETGKFGKKDILTDFDIQTSTFVVRNKFDLPPWLKDIWSGDFFFCWFSLGKGAGYYENRPTSCYRLNPDGGQSFKDPMNRMMNVKKNLIGLNHLLSAEKDDNEVFKLITMQILEANKQILGFSYELLDRKSMFKYFNKVVLHYPISKKVLLLYGKCLVSFLLPKFIILRIRQLNKIFKTAFKKKL